MSSMYRMACKYVHTWDTCTYCGALRSRSLFPPLWRLECVPYSLQCITATAASTWCIVWHKPHKASWYQGTDLWMVTFDQGLINFSVNKKVNICMQHYIAGSVSFIFLSSEPTSGLVWGCFSLSGHGTIKDQLWPRPGCLASRLKDVRIALSTIQWMVYKGDTVGSLIYMSH